jgi:hypothetical protein
MRYAWSALNRLQKGIYGEYFARDETVLGTQESTAA